MKLRLMQVLLVIPCVLTDVFILFVVLFPTWIVCGTDAATSKESASEWLFSLKNKE